MYPKIKRLVGSLLDKTKAPGEERYRRAALGSITAALNKGIALISTLISVPLTLSYLSREEYGLWLSLSSAVAVLTFADLGIGNQLLNTVSSAVGKHRRDEIAKAVSSAWFPMILLGGTVIGGAALAVRYLPLATIFGVTSVAGKRDLTPSLLIMAICFALNMPFDIVQRTQAGMQAIFNNNLWRGGGSLMSLVGIVVSCEFRLPFPYLVLSLFGLPLCATILNFCHFFHKNNDLRPRRSHFDAREAKRLVTSGLFFVVAGAGSSIVTAAPILLTTNMLGAGAAAISGVALRLYLIPYSICELFWSPLWPAYGEAWAKREHRWIWKTVALTVPCISIGMLGMLILVVFNSQVIVSVWTGGKLALPFAISVAAALLMFVRVFRGALSTPANGCGFIRTQAYLFTIAAFSCIAFAKMRIAGNTPECILLFCVLLEIMVTGGIAWDIVSILKIGRKEQKETGPTMAGQSRDAELAVPVV
jgi:O-antigen/teichoic acid export membrane protein